MRSFVAMIPIQELGASSTDSPMTRLYGIHSLGSQADKPNSLVNPKKHPKTIRKLRIIGRHSRVRKILEGGGREPTEEFRLCVLIVALV